MTLRRFVAAALVAAAALPGFLDAGCSSKTITQGGLMVVFATDGTLAQADRLHFEFQSTTSEKVYWNEDYAITPDTALPTSIAVATNGTAGGSVLINASLWAGSTLLDDRENQVIQIPTDRVAELAILFSSKCTADAVDEGDGGATSRCGASQTCDPATGSCTGGQVNAGNLPTFEPDGGLEAGSSGHDTGPSPDAPAPSDDSGQGPGQDATIGPLPDSGNPAPDSSPPSDAPASPCLPGLACNVACANGGATTITGKVYDPALRNPLPNIVVYVPLGPLAPLPRGVPTGSAACSCDGLYPTPALAFTTTAADGSFTLQNVPVGAGVPLVLQAGKWRRRVTVNTVACAENAQPDKSLAFLTTLAPGAGSTDDSIPDFAVSTGIADTLECVLSRIGLASSEYVPGAATTGHVHIFNGGATTETNPMAGSPASDVALWSAVDQLTPFDYVFLSCEGTETYNAQPAVLEAYTNGGGRVLASHFHYAWFSGPLATTGSYTAPADWGSNLAQWSGNTTSTLLEIGAKPSTQATTPFGMDLALTSWLTAVGALGIENVPAGDLPLFSPRFNAQVTAANTHSQALLSLDPSSADGGALPGTMAFSFATPVNAPALDGGEPAYCGRVVYSDLHVTGDTHFAADLTTAPPPASCAARALSPAEEAIEFFVFDTLVGPACLSTP